MEGYHGAEYDRASETSFVEDEEEEEGEEEEEEEEEEAAVGPEEAEELTNSLKDLIHNEDVKPKLQYIMTNPSFSMVTIQSEDSGITWETSSSRCSTPWASETSTTSGLYSMESSPVGSPPGKVFFIMDEGKIVRKRKRKPSNRVPAATSLMGSQGNKKRDSSGMQRQEPRAVLGDVQASVLNVEQVEAQDADEEMLDDKEDLENITEEPVKRVPIRSIFRESRLRKVGPILGGPVQARIQLFNSIFGGTEPTPETLNNNKIERSSSVSGDSEQFLETSVKERLQKFNSLSQATHLKSFPKAQARNLEMPSQRKRGQRQPIANANQVYSSPTPPLEKHLTNKGDVSSENIKPKKMKDKSCTSSSSRAETTLQHEEQNDKLSLLENPNQLSGHSLKSCPPEEARKQQSYSPVDKKSITEQKTSISLESDDKSEKQLSLPSAENSNKEQDESLLTAPDNLNEPKEQEMQPSSTPQSISADFVNELDKESFQSSLPTASMAEHPERDAQKSAVQSSLPSTPSAKSKYSTLSEARQEDILPHTSETAQFETEHLLLPHYVDETEKQEAECRSSNALTETGQSDLFHSLNKESQKTSPQETQSVHLKQTKSKQDLSSSFQETGEQGIKLKSSIPEKTDSKYFGISYPTHTETEETQKTSATNETIDMGHSGLSNEKNKQTENAQVEMEHPDFSYSSEEMDQSERTQLEIEHPDFSFFKGETEEVEGVQMEMEHPDFSFSRGEMEEAESEQLDSEHPDFLYARKEMEALESTYLETEQPDFSYSREEVEESESSQMEKEYPELLFSMKETEELENTQLETEQSDFSYSMEETEESESSQLEKEHPELLFSTKERGELESSQLQTEQPDFSYSMEETEESESSQLEKEHPELLFSMKETELKSTQLETEQSDFSYSVTETELLESSQQGKERPEPFFPTEERMELKSPQLKTEQSDFSCSMEETSVSQSLQLEKEHPELPRESAQMHTEQPDFSYSREEVEESESSQLEKEHPDFFPKEHTEKLQNAQLEMKHETFSYAREEMVQSETAQLERGHPDFSLSREEVGELESAQLEIECKDFLFSREESEKQKYISFELEQSESYSPEEIEKEETAELARVPSDLSCLIGAEKENTTELHLTHPGKFDSTRRDETEQTGYMETAHSDLLYPSNKRKQQELAQPDMENSLTSCFGDNREQLQPVQQDSQHGDKLYSHVKDVQEETTQMHSEHPVLSHFTRKEQQYKTSQSRAEHPEIYSTGETEQQEILKPRLEQTDSPYSQEETAQEAIQTDLEVPELSHFVSEAEQCDRVQLASENRDFLFTTEEVMQEGVDSGCLRSSHSIDRAKPWEMVQMEQEQLLPSSSPAASQQQGTPSLDVAKPGISYSFGRIGQRDTVQRELEQEQQETNQHKAMQMEYSGLSETSGEEPQVTDQVNLAQQEIAQPVLVHLSLPCSFSGQMQEKMQTEPACIEQAFYVSKEMQEEKTQCESEQPFLSHLRDKTEQQETVQTEQTVLSSSGREDPLEMKMSSEAEQQHSTLPFLSRQEETTPLVMKHPDFPWNSGEAKPGDIIEQESGHESMKVESTYSHLSWSDGQKKQQETPQLDSKYPGLSFSFSKNEKQIIQNVESKHKELPKVSRKRASPATPHIDSNYPDLTYSLAKANEPEAATREMKYPDLSHSTDDTNQQEIVLLDQKYRIISIDGEKQHQATNQKLEQGKLPYSPSKTEQLKHAQEAFEQPGLPVSIDRPDDERVPSEAEHTVVIHHLENTEVQQKVQLNREQIYPFGKAEQKTVQPEVERPHLAHSLDTAAAAEMVEAGQGHTDVTVQTALLKCKHSDPACSVTEVQETSQQVLEEPDALYVCGKKQIPPPHLELGQADMAFTTNKVGQQGDVLRHPIEEKPLSRGEHPQATKEKLEAPDASSHSGKSKQRELAKPESKQSDSLCFIDKTQETRQLVFGKADTSSWPGKTKQAKTAEDKQLSVLHSSKNTTQGEKAQPKWRCSQLSYSVSEAEEETTYTHMKSKCSDLSTGILEHHEIIQPETEKMDLPRSINETQHLQTAEVDLEYLDSLHSTSMVQQQGKIQPEQEHPGDFLSSLSKEEQCENTGMQAEYPELQCSVEKTEALQNSQAKSEHACLSFSVGAAEPHQSAQPVLEERNLLHFPVKTKRSWAASLDSEHTDDAMGNVLHSNLPSSVSELKQSAQLEVRQEKGRYTLNPEETVHLILEQPLFSSSSVTAEQLKRAPLEAEFQGKKEKQEMEIQESKHSDLSCSTDKTQQQETTQAGLGQTDLSSYPVKAAQPQTVQVHQDLENFTGKTECQKPVQTEVEHLEKELPSSSYSICKAVSQEATQMDLGQQDLTYTLGKPDETKTVQAELKHSGLFYSGKKEQEMVLSELQHPQVSYFVKELEEEVTHQKSSYADLSCSTGQQEYHKIEQAEGEEIGLSIPADKPEHLKSVKEQQPGLLEFFGKLKDSIVETEESETQPLSYTFGRTEMQGSAQLDFEQADLLSPSDKAEKHEMTPLRAGHSENQDTGAALSLTAQLETEQDLSISTEEAWSQKIQPYSPPTEPAVSLPLGVSHSVSETKPKESPKSGALSPEHTDLTHTAPAESGFFLARKEAENTKDNLHLPVAAQLKAEHVILAEGERERTSCYFHRTTELGSEQLNLSYSTDKEENLGSQDYLAVPLKLESASSVPFYSADKTSQQGIASYSKPAAEYLVPTQSLAEQEKQSMQSLIPQPPQPERKHTVPPHDEKELQKNNLCSPKPASLKTVELESVSLKHTQDQDKEQDQNHLLKQLRSPSKLTTKQSKQEMQLGVQTVPSLVTTESRMTAVGDQQAAASDSFAIEKSVSVVFTGYEVNQNIPTSLSDVVGMIGKQSNVISSEYAEQEERHEMQQSFADQKHISLEHPEAVSTDPFNENAAHKTQHYSGEWGSPSSEEMKPISSSSDEKYNPAIPSFGLASWLAEEVKSQSISPARTAEVDEQEIPISPNETSGFESKQILAAHCNELTVHGATKNKGHMFSVSHPVSSKISHGISLDTTHRTQRCDLPSLAGDNEGPDKAPEYETRIGTHTNMESMQHPEVDKVSEEPAHYFRGEKKERDHVSTVEDCQHASETAEQKDLFNIISEGYEILNIHAPKHISSVDQEESKHMPDKLEYLETNYSLNRKLADDGYRALAAGTTIKTSESSVLGKPASHEMNKLVKNDDGEELGEMQQGNPVLPEDNDNAELGPNNGMADMDYFEKYTLIDDRSQIKPHFERPRSLFPVVEDPSEPVEETMSLKESTEVDTLEEEFSFLENVDEVFYGTVKGETKMQSYADVPEPLPLQKSIDTSSKKVAIVEDEQKSPGTPLFDTEEGVLERSLLFPTTVAAVNPELLEEPPALSFLYKDLYAEAVGEKTKDETPSDEESGKSNVSFPSRNSDTDDGTGIYFEKYILKDEIPNKATGPLKDETPDDEPFSGGISVLSSEDKHNQGSVDVQYVRTEVLPETEVMEKVQADSDIQATICKPIHAIPFGSKAIHSNVRTDTTEQREEENVPEESTEELPEQSSNEIYSQSVDYRGATYQETDNNQEEWHDTTAVLQMEKYVPYVRTPVEDTEDDQYAHENVSCIPAIQQTEKLDLQKEEQHSDIYEDLTESMDYDVITQEELLQDEISSQLTHEELLFEDRYSFEHAGDSYEIVNEPEQRTPDELEDSGFVVVYPEKSATNIPQIESPQREVKKAQADTYCYHCKCPISAIDKLFGEHKDHEVTTLDDAAAKMKDQLSEMLKAVEEKSIKIEDFVSDIESLFNSVEENCKKNAELLEKQNEEMLKKVVAQYDEKSENFEEVKKMKMEYLYEQMVNFQQTVDSAKDTLDATVKEMEEIDGFIFLSSSKELNKRLLSAMDATLSLEKVPSAFSLFEHYADSPGQSNQHSLKQVAVPQTPTLIPQEPNSATSTSIAIYWAVNEGDAIDCFQVYCMEEPQASKDAGALVEEYRVTVKESHCILEDLEPDRCYGVWVMAMNGTGCGLPSEKAIFKTAPAVPTIRAEDCTVCWDTATVRWHASSVSAEFFSLEYCRQHSPEGEGLRSFTGIQRPELKVTLEPNVNYFFYLRAVNSFGTSEQSEAALISTKGTRFLLLSNTAHPALQISSNMIRLPKKTKFTGIPSVLGEQLPARGRHYWEIIVSACRSYRIGICYEAASQSNVLGLNDASWCMQCCPTQTSFLYRFLHTGVMSDVHVTDQPARIGILLDYSSSRLLFFNAEKRLLLFAVRHKFTDAAHPAFVLERAGVLTVCTGMELPEFVKNS